MKKKKINILVFITGIVLLFAATTVKAGTEEVIGGLILGGIIGSEIQKNKDDRILSYEELMQIKRQGCRYVEYGRCVPAEPIRKNKYVRPDVCWWAEPQRCPNYNTWDNSRREYIRQLEFEIERVNRLEEWFK